MTDVSDTRSTLPDEPPAEGADQPTNERKSKAGTTVTSTNTVPDGTLDEPDMERAGVWRLALVVAALVALWWWQGWALVVVILALLFMITMHELGHYLMAKRAGMKVTQFFIGFGPRIWSTQRGETEYGIRAIPAGAFVKVPGMLRDEEVSASDEARSYRQASFKDRVAMASAGSAMHFLMAFILLFAHFAFFDQADPDVWSVESVVPGSAAAEAGMASGDRVLSVDGAKVGGQEDLSDEVRARPGETVPIVVERDGKTLDLTATLGTRAPVIGTVGEDLSLFFIGDQAVVKGYGEREDKGGLSEDAVITEINDVPINSAVDLKAATKAAAGGVLEIDYVADGETRTQSTYLKLGKAVAATEPEGMIGTTSGYAEVGKNPVEAAGASVTTFWQLSRDSVTGLVTVLNPANLVDFFGRAATTGPSGGNVSDEPTPAATARQASMEQDATRPMSLIGATSIATGLAEVDWGQLLLLLAVLNIFIGLFNLVPLLPFDGGHIAIAFYERIREKLKGDGRRYFIDPAKMYPVAVIVVGVLGLLFLSTVYMDVVSPIKL